MLPYSSWPWLTHVERRVIDRAIERVVPPDSSPRRWIEGYLRYFYASDALAISAVVLVAETIVQVLSAPRVNVSDEERHEAALQLIDAVIVELDADRDRSSPTSWTFEQFAAEARATIERCSWWITFVSSVSIPAVTRALRQQDETVPTPPPDTRPPLTRTAFAKALNAHRQTITDMITRGELITVPVGRQQRIPQSELDRLRGNPRWQYHREDGRVRRHAMVRAGKRRNPS